jgi:hypothetical protein
MNVVGGMLVAGGLALGWTNHADASVRICSFVCDDTRPPDIYVPFEPVETPVLTPFQPTILQMVPVEVGGEWTYSFGLVGRSDLASIALPDVVAWDLSKVLTADMWLKSVDGLAVGQLGTATWTLINQLSRPEPRSLFQFKSAYAPTTAVLKLRDSAGALYEREVFLPLTPEALAAGYAPAVLAVPEPSGVLLFAVGAAVVAWGRRKA